MAHPRSGSSSTDSRSNWNLVLFFFVCVKVNSRQCTSYMIQKQNIKLLIKVGSYTNVDTAISQQS